jgi:hypothetical protein
MSSMRIEDIDAPSLTRGLPSLMDTSSGVWPLKAKQEASMNQNEVYAGIDVET